MRRLYKGLVALLMIAAVIGMAAGAPATQKQANNKKVAKPAAAAAKTGAQVFTQNCGRCHNAPEELSPREVRAVVRQMRVRANLSAEDEQLLLKFLAP
jgi:mono/diheme cytochrome c family protein